VSQASVFGPSWQGSLADLANIIQHIKRQRVFGRLSLRNLEHLSIAHLYFRAGCLVHVAGHRGDARTILTDLREWRRAIVRFDRGVTTLEVTLGDEHEQLLMDVLNHLGRRGIVMLPQQASRSSRVIESDVIVAAEARQLITPLEWRILVEGTRRVSLAVAHLVGPREALTVLQDILDDCSATFPAFASLKIAPSGYLQVTDRSHLDRMSREDLLEGFTALIAICQHFCSPIIGEYQAHRLMIQALQELGPTLASMGVFRIDSRLLSRGSP